MDAPSEKRVKNPKELIKSHKLPCGPTTINADGVCRRRLRDRFDVLLDKLTQDTHPEGKDAEVDEIDDEFEMQKEAEKKREEIERQLEQEGVMFDQELQRKLKEETPEQKKKRMIEEGKMKAEVKKEVLKYEEKLMGNTKLLQNPTGKIKKR
jgi:hypothetical protein